MDRSITDPEVFVKTNILGTQVLLDAAKEVGVTKFVHISTDEVYGELDFDPTTFLRKKLLYNRIVHIVQVKHLLIY